MKIDSAKVSPDASSLASPAHRARSESALFGRGSVTALAAIVTVGAGWVGLRMPPSKQASGQDLGTESVLVEYGGDGRRASDGKDFVPDKNGPLAAYLAPPGTVLSPFLSGIAPATSHSGAFQTPFDVTAERLAASGKVVILDFWATWCPNCHTATPFMNSLSGKFGGKLQVVAVSPEDSDPVASWLLNQSFDSPRTPAAPILVGAEALVQHYGVRAFPTIIVLGPSGEVLLKQEGADHKAIEKAVEDAVKMLPAAVSSTPGANANSEPKAGGDSNWYFAGSATGSAQESLVKVAKERDARPADKKQFVGEALTRTVAAAGKSKQFNDFEGFRAFYSQNLPSNLWKGDKQTRFNWVEAALRNTGIMKNTERAQVVNDLLGIVRSDPTPSVRARAAFGVMFILENTYSSVTGRAVLAGAMGQAAGAPVAVTVSPVTVSPVTVAPMTASSLGAANVAPAAFAPGGMTLAAVASHDVASPEASSLNGSRQVEPREAVAPLEQLRVRLEELREASQDPELRLSLARAIYLTQHDKPVYPPDAGFNKVFEDYQSGKSAAKRDYDAFVKTWLPEGQGWRNNDVELALGTFIHQSRDGLFDEQGNPTALGSLKVWYLANAVSSKTPPLNKIFIEHPTLVGSARNGVADAILSLEGKDATLQLNLLAFLASSPSGFAGITLDRLEKLKVTARNSQSTQFYPDEGSIAFDRISKELETSRVSSR